jgi:hypothetical protein
MGADGGDGAGARGAEGRDAAAAIDGAGGAIDRGGGYDGTPADLARCFLARPAGDSSFGQGRHLLSLLAARAFTLPSRSLARSLSPLLA